MNKTNLIFFLLLMSVTIHAQDSISLIPINYHDEFESRIKKRAASPDSWIFYSKNKKNAALIETYLPDKFKEEKAQRKIIKLYDYSGNLLASSAPMDLYDWTVIPMGDDETILVVFPAGTARQADILVLKRKGIQFEMGDEIHEKTGNFSIDTDFSGEHFVIALSAEKDVRDYTEIRLFNNNGSIVWHKNFPEPDFQSITINNNYIATCLQNNENKKSLLFFYDFEGRAFMEYSINSVVGNFDIQCSDDFENRYCGVSTLRGVHLFDVQSGKKIKYLEVNKTQDTFYNYKIRSDGTIIVLSLKKMIISPLNGKDLIQRHQFYGYPAIQEVSPSIIIEFRDQKESIYYEVKY